MQSESIKVGSVTLSVKDGELVIEPVKVPGFHVCVPVKSLEAWALRKLRDEAFQPSREIGEHQ